MRSGFALLSMIGLAAAARLPLVKRDGPPACAADCFANIPNTPGQCNPTDTACLCTSPSTTGYLRSCLSASCPTSQIDAANAYFQSVCQNNGSFGAPSSAAQASSAAATSSSVAPSSAEASSAGTSSAPASPSPSSAATSATSAAASSASSQAAPSSAAPVSSSAASSTAAPASSAPAQSSQAAQSNVPPSSSPSIVVVTSTAVIQSSTPSVVIATSTNFVTAGAASTGGSVASGAANGQSQAASQIPVVSAAGSSSAALPVSQVKMGVLGLIAAAAGLFVVA